MQWVVNHVGLPLGLPGSCAGTTRTVLRQPRSQHTRPALATPPTAEEWGSAFGPIRTVRVPHAIHDTMLRFGHHLGDCVDDTGALKLSRAAVRAQVARATADIFVKWFDKYKDMLQGYMDEDVPRWQAAPKTSDVPPPAAVMTETVVGARLAKQEKTQRVIHSGQLYDVELGYSNRRLAQEHLDIHPPCRQELVIHWIPAC